jgi:hypothetical protein
MATPFVAGTVAWSGENPGMYLKEGTDGPFVTLVSWFRVVHSPHGRGHALVLLEAPRYEGRLPEEPEVLNVCVTDNEPLARWLVQEFVVHFAAFRGAAGLDTMDYRPLTGTAVSGDSRSAHVEWVKGEGVDATLAWEELGAPYLMVLGPDRSATGRHTLVSLFVDAARVTARVNGRSLRGRPVPRDRAGHNGSSAFLAFAETWIGTDAA